MAVLGYVAKLIVEDHAGSWSACEVDVWDPATASHFSNWSLLLILWNYNNTLGFVVNFRWVATDGAVGPIALLSIIKMENQGR